RRRHYREALLDLLERLDRVRRLARGLERLGVLEPRPRELRDLLELVARLGDELFRVSVGHDVFEMLVGASVVVLRERFRSELVLFLVAPGAGAVAAPAAR